MVGSATANGTGERKALIGHRKSSLEGADLDYKKVSGKQKAAGGYPN
jgi:hypothetical protein